MLKAPHPLNAEEDPDRLRDYVENIELAHELLGRNKRASTISALIILDALVDGVTHRICTEAFHREDFTLQFQPPRFDGVERNQADRYFDGKLRVLLSESVVTEDEASLLRIAHSYRNQVHHRAVQKAAIARVLADALLRLSVSLLQRLFGNVEQYGGTYEWLARLDLPIDRFSTTTILDRVREMLCPPKETSWENLWSYLLDDLRGRVAALDALIIDELHAPDNERLGEILQEEEWADQFDEIEHSRELRELRYRIVEGNAPTRDECLAAETRLFEAATKSRDAFVPTLTVHGLESLRQRIAAPKKPKSEAHMLDRYQGFDRELARYELILQKAAWRLDHLISIETDIRRGK